MSSLPQRRLEKLIDLFSKLRKAKIFPPNELKGIVNKIRDFEYQIDRASVTKFEYLKYVAYLTELHEQIRQARSQFNHILLFKEVNVKLNQHIKKLLWKAVQREKNDIKLWYDYIEFCKRSSRMEDVSKTFVAMLQIHPDKEDAWVSAAKYHFKVMRSPNVSRNLLQTGIKDNPKSIKLWKEYFGFELKNADMALKRLEILSRNLNDDNVQNLSKAQVEIDSNDAVISGKIAVVIFKNAIPAVISEDLTVAKLFLPVIDEFDPKLRIPVKKEMIRLMEENFPDKEEVFDFKAQCLSDKHFVCDFTVASEDDLESIDDVKCLELMEKVYREGLAKLPTTLMWNLFIGFHLEILSKSNIESEEIQAKRTDSLLLIFDECWRSELMSRHAFLEWILILEAKNNFDKIDKLMAKGCQQWSKYADVWFLRLSIMSKRVNFKEELKRLFARAIKEIEYRPTDKDERDEKDSAGLKECNMQRKTMEDVWNFYIEWSSKHLHPTAVLKFIEKQFIELLTNAGGNLINQRKLSSILKPELLKKSIELKKDGLRPARYYYEKYKNHPPVVESFFQEMISIEKEQVPRDNGRVIAIYEDLINHFGESDHLVWLDYCRFIIEGPKPHTVGLIHHRACKTLNPAEVTNFVAAYSLMQNDAI